VLKFIEPEICPPPPNPYFDVVVGLA